MFGRLSKLLWSSTYDAKQQEFNNRVANELAPYLESLEGIQLMNEIKRDFEAQISYYFGASKKSDRLASFTNINKFIREHEFVVNKTRKTISGVKQQSGRLKKYKSYRTRDGHFEFVLILFKARPFTVRNKKENES